MSRAVGFASLGIVLLAIVVGANALRQTRQSDSLSVAFGEPVKLYFRSEFMIPVESGGEPPVDFEWRLHVTFLADGTFAYHWVPGSDASVREGELYGTWQLRRLGEGGVTTWYLMSRPNGRELNAQTHEWPVVTQGVDGRTWFVPVLDVERGELETKRTWAIRRKR